MKKPNRRHRRFHQPTPPNLGRFVVVSDCILGSLAVGAVKLRAGLRESAFKDSYPQVDQRARAAVEEVRWLLPAFYLRIIDHFDSGAPLDEFQINGEPPAPTPLRVRVGALEALAVSTATAVADDLREAWRTQSAELPMFLEAVNLVAAVLPLCPHRATAYVLDLFGDAPGPLHAATPIGGGC